MALKRSTCSEGAESGGLDAWVIRLSFTGPPAQPKPKAGSLIVFARLVEDARTGADKSARVVEVHALGYAPQPAYGAVRPLLCSQ